MEKENILPLKGYDGYEVSDRGVVYSLKSGRKRKVREELIDASSGLIFRSVRIVNNSGVQVRRYIHRLVYATFHDVDLPSSVQVYFKNYNCFDCSIENLTLDCEQYVPQEGEYWIGGYEGKYTTYRNEVYSVTGEYPKKLKPLVYADRKLYFLYKDGKRNKFYVENI